jgi:REP element-mobilizing transposase RayT
MVNIRPVMGMMRGKSQVRFDFRRRRKDGRLAKKPGPKPKKFKLDVAHRTRAELNPRHPVHVVMRVTPELARLRTRKAYQVVRQALRACVVRTDYRVVHISIQKDHVHAIVEAEGKQALAKGMRGFAISVAKRFNRAIGRKSGTVFPRRYHATVLTTPTQVRRAIAYVLNNWRKHGVDGPWRVDPFSSASQFGGWATAHGYAAQIEPLPVGAAQSWLLREGWMRGGALIGLDEVPGPRP